MYWKQLMTLMLLCKSWSVTNHQRIIFNGNGYSSEWQKEAADRGLSNLPCTAKALPTYISEKNIDLVTRHGIFTENEFRARHEIHQESYNKLIHIEARTMVDMVMHQILPAALSYSSDLAESINRKRSAVKLKAGTETRLLTKISNNCDSLYEKTVKLTELLEKVPTESCCAMEYYSDIVIPIMQKIREDADHLESVTAKSYWPYPTYSDILYY